MTDLGQADIEWEEPEEVWWFDYWTTSKPVTGPYKIFENNGYLLVVYKDGNKWYIPKEDAYPTKKEAVVAHYKLNEKRIKQEQRNLDERLQLLKEYYSEEYYE